MTARLAMSTNRALVFMAPSVRREYTSRDFLCRWKCATVRSHPSMPNKWRCTMRALQLLVVVSSVFVFATAAAALSPADCAEIKRLEEASNKKAGGVDSKYFEAA